MDGARLLNAVAATGVTAAEYCKHVTAVWIDFCKILGAPMGAVLVGSQEFIDNAWYYKFQQGGGMHQAGILAAGCLYGLEHHFPLISEVHKNTKYLAKKLNMFSWIELDVELVETNIVIFQINTPQINARHLQRLLLEKSIRVLAIDDDKIRAILHLDIGIPEIDYMITSLSECEETLLSKEYFS
jgi:threonine aldolase